MCANSSSQRDEHRFIAPSRQNSARCSREEATCKPLDEYLRAWLDVTRDANVLEVVAWRWLVASGTFEEEDDPTEEERGSTHRRVEDRIESGQTHQSLCGVPQSFQDARASRVAPSMPSRSNTTGGRRRATLAATPLSCRVSMIPSRSTSG